MVCSEMRAAGVEMRRDTAGQAMRWVMSAGDVHV